jgi:predicted N-acetyltransferase YhbS
MSNLEKLRMLDGFEIIKADVSSLSSQALENIIELVAKTFNDGKDYSDKILHDPELVTCVMILIKDQLIAYAGIVKRQIIHNDKSYVIGGLADMVVDASFRYRGLGQTVVENVNKVITSNQYDIGMGFCHPNLLPFYGKAGWLHKQIGKVYTSSHETLTDQGCTILFPCNSLFTTRSFWYTDNLVVGPNSW